ncbi:MAG: hypothetical protein HZA83_02775, partial [Thaumarchaeota archaeon]|nr:hypothetical protein [Nitrososphaerota archaeon]
ATLYVSIHFGTDKSQAEFQQLKVNGVQKKNDVNWLYLQESSSGGEITTAAFGLVDVTNETVAENNEIYVEIGTPKYHSHLHPGMRLVVTYSLSETLSEANKTFKKRYYFDNVVGRRGAWATASFFIPPDAKNATAMLHLKAKNVDNTTDYWNRDATDVMVFVNDSLYYKDGYQDENYWHCWSYYHYNIVGVMNPEYLFNITSKLVNGTNVVSAYFNNYGDCDWGNQDSQIYSDPLTDSNSSSYIEVSYSLEKLPFSYGEIDLTKEILFGGEAENPKTFSFNITPNQSRIINSFTHIAQGFSSMIEVYAWHEGSPENLVFKSPAVRAVPSTVYIQPVIWSVGNNSIRMRDFQPTGSTSPKNYILPWSSLEYSYTVKALVGYGSVFNTSELAIGDAKQRLTDQMGAESITSEDITIENKSVQGIRWLWGPSLFKTMVWEK